jgi:hypothetical protein
MKPEPKPVTIRAVDVIPYKHALWYSVAGVDGPFWNDVVGKAWSKDGTTVIILLESFNSMFRAPDTELELGEYAEGDYHRSALVQTQEQFLAKRPVMVPQCVGSAATEGCQT